MLPSDEIADTCRQIRVWHQRARYAMKRQSQADRSLEAFVRVNVFNFSTFDDEKDRKKKSMAALKLIADIRKGEVAKDVDVVARIVFASDKGREGFDAARNEAEREMCKLVRRLPGYEFTESVRGFGEKGFAQIVGECGDLTGYAGPAKVWKRLGLAPYEGLAMSSWKRETWRPRALSSEEWIANPFVAERYAIVAQIATWLVNAQMISAEKSGTQFGEPKGAYGEIYLARRLRTVVTHPDWTPMHARADALRVTVKELLKHLWCAWHGRQTASMMSTNPMPRPNLSPQGVGIAIVRMMPIRCLLTPFHSPQGDARERAFTGLLSIDTVPALAPLLPWSHKSPMDRPNHNHAQRQKCRWAFS